MIEINNFTSPFNPPLPAKISLKLNYNIERV